MNQKIEQIRQGYHVLKHGHNRRGKRSLTYGVWGSMLARCNNPKDKSYSRYGGRGIKVCKRWYMFENFLADMGERQAGMSIERIDNSKGYSPDNCKWIPLNEQSKNRRNTHFLTFKGTTRNLTDWAKETGINRETLLSRVKRGLSPEQALTKAIYER